MTATKVELARGRLSAVLGINGKWKKLYFAFFINSELSIAFIFPQVKRTSGAQGISGLTDTVLTSIFFERTIWAFFPPFWPHCHGSTLQESVEEKKKLGFVIKNCNRKEEQDTF